MVKSTSSALVFTHSYTLRLCKTENVLAELRICYASQSSQTVISNTAVINESSSVCFNFSEERD